MAFWIVLGTAYLGISDSIRWGGKGIVGSYNPCGRDVGLRKVGSAVQPFLVDLGFVVILLGYAGYCWIRKLPLEGK
jgi:hypothetical protein